MPTNFEGQIRTAASKGRHNNQRVTLVTTAVTTTVITTTEEYRDRVGEIVCSEKLLRNGMEARTDGNKSHNEFATVVPSPFIGFF